MTVVYNKKYENIYLDSIIFVNIENNELLAINIEKNKDSLIKIKEYINNKFTLIDPEIELISSSETNMVFCFKDTKSPEQLSQIKLSYSDRSFIPISMTDGTHYLFEITVRYCKIETVYNEMQHLRMQKLNFIYEKNFNSLEEFERDLKMIKKIDPIIIKERCFGLKFMPIIKNPNKKSEKVEFYEALMDNDTGISSELLIRTMDKYRYSQYLDYTNFIYIVDIVKKNKSISISMNVGKDIIHNIELCKNMCDILKENRINRGSIIFEILEYQMIEKENIVLFINTFKELGCLIAIDDFGVGYHSLEMVCTLDIDYIKIGGELFEQSLNNEMLKIILSGISKACKIKNINLIVEKVYSDELLKFAQDELGVNCVQGFLYPSKTLKEILEQ